VDLRRELVMIETDRHRIEGKMTLPSEGHRSRLSDHVNRRDQQFFTVQDAEIAPLDGSSESRRAPVLMVARAHIRLIVPSGDA